jgi:hypothetical protein
LVLSVAQRRNRGRGLAIAYGIALYRTVLTRARLDAATFPLD